MSRSDHESRERADQAAFARKMIAEDERATYKLNRRTDRERKIVAKTRACVAPSHGLRMVPAGRTVEAVVLPGVPDWRGRKARG